MMYETAGSTPKGDSLRFMLFVLVYIMRSDRSFQATMLQAGATVAAGSESENAGKNLQQQMDTFIEHSYPHMSGFREEEQKKMRSVLKTSENTAFKVSRVSFKKGRNM